ncbi:IscS subfamily cysteine desulfurase [Legionella taurinensis]|uniref:cysteine desulfurase n=1 Tax=Legionella taurinensis TaxID=70611 RepID=A0AB38N761_9GAMM|nr:IscS subfamily cysteine desulfurase [Legionella taurinensis]MDX1836627.1 IscS subfamily cysteine desulfurase [Legionella taurinensis]PUT42916.1 IscS subfamily cysteine desulfurase [Legionella taurinensis]PUT45471.1 IscS subfamily cysteine desulfurase [Legionella taurinensis]PUT46954.1 IscS subfamily cysteine desulfurase [Legionella taurinensis]PUT49238.1 IscS subfamily cysteine desulfurase [Legionella taurinensis]
MKQLPIYFDYMATTPVDPRVVARMVRYLGPDGIFGNPSSISHPYGKEAAEAVETARAQIAEVIHAEPRDLIFTSGATEANNLAILGAARFYQHKGRHLITMSTEHKAVLDSIHQLKKEGFTVTCLPPEPDGLLSLERLKAALTPETILVSVMHVNNETGVIQDITAIGDLLKDKGIIFHVDAAQSVGKLPVDLEHMPVGLMSLSSHKNYGPKGIGALYIRHKPRLRLLPLSYGGGHEQGLRSGTLATHQIVGMGEAFYLGEQTRVAEQARLLAMRQRLWQGIKHLPGIRLNGHEHQRIAGNLNLTFKGIEGETLLLALRELALSTASACSSASNQPSYVLKALGLSDEDAYSSIRLSLGRFTTEADIEKAIHTICQQVTRLHEIVP